MRKFSEAEIKQAKNIVESIANDAIGECIQSADLHAIAAINAILSVMIYHLNQYNLDHIEELASLHCEMSRKGTSPKRVAELQKRGHEIVLLWSDQVSALHDKKGAANN